MKSLTRLEIIEKLKSLPDYPVVIEKDCDELRSTVITSIRVVDAVKKRGYGVDEYSDFPGLDKNYEKVIWIS